MGTLMMIWVVHGLIAVLIYTAEYAFVADSSLTYHQIVNDLYLLHIQSCMH